MAEKESRLNAEVTSFLDELHHPFRAEIEQLRICILNAHSQLRELIKWNGPNYAIGNEDRITMKIQPPKQIQLIFHRGVKKLEPLPNKVINDEANLLTWKENDRAVATFKNMTDIEQAIIPLTKVVRDWIAATVH